MIKKVLIAEDHESVNISIQKTLEELRIVDFDYVYYCDDAITRIHNAYKSGNSYDLLITDLSFDEDKHRPQKIKSGTELVTAARQIQQDLKVLVFSIEERPARIGQLFEKQEIDGFVRKARNDAKELKTAIETIAAHQRYFPRHLAQLVKPQNSYVFSEYEITLISLLAKGMSQKEMPAYLKENHITPSGQSSIEKRFNQMRTALNFTKNEQLVIHLKEQGLL
jgi:two-component system capsular synthesis response regulator RcsB